GKGLTLDAAKASGLMESVESWHAERIEHPLKLSSFADLRPNHAVLDIERLPVMRTSQFNPNLPILWIEALNLKDKQNHWIHYEIVHTNYSLPSPSGSGCFIQSSNGLASGNHYLEAVSHAICECIERDASSLWHQLPQSERDATKLDLKTIECVECVSLLKMLDSAGLEITLWDTQSDLDVVCFECVLLDQRQVISHIGQGAGCHPDKNIALLRAITEAVQVRTAYIAGSRDDLSNDEYSTQGHSERLEAFNELIGEGSGWVDFADLQSQTFGTFDEDVNWLVARLDAFDIDQVLCVNLSRSPMNIDVVRVVIPGLEGPHDDDEYVAGLRATAMQA
ncbi:MAG: YcaO-like protein with predicted kinase domain, partial [Gammaproteobacteria bacterium]